MVLRDNGLSGTCLLSCHSEALEIISLCDVNENETSELRGVMFTQCFVAHEEKFPLTQIHLQPLITQCRIQR